jgi:cardiolipin synthase
LLERGVKIYENQGVFDHTKFMTVDGIWSLIGSTNWDPRSLRLNFEFNLACFDQASTAELNAGFAAKQKESVLVTQDALDAEGVFPRIRDGLARMFIPML